MVRLLNIAEMPRVDGMSTPFEVYTVIKEPALLAGMRYPIGISWDKLKEAGFTSIVCLSENYPSYDPSPLQELHTVCLEDLCCGGPLDSKLQEKLVRSATKTVFEGLGMGEDIIIHCMGGTGRTGTVIGCVLRELGVPANTVIGYLNDLNVARGVGGWPENKWQAEMVWKY
ncbi:MAG TPA: tyrosine-protein phosphatase [Methanocella sp.]|nr:tyrosine-protein phosphatase [Methanocella sp.]